MRKLTFLIGGAMGYVLGARAGREHYEKIKGMAVKAKDNPKVQEATQHAAARGNELMHQAQDKAGALTEKASEKAPDWMPGKGSDSSSPVSPATTSKSASTTTPTAMADGNSRAATP